MTKATWLVRTIAVAVTLAAMAVLAPALGPSALPAGADPAGDLPFTTARAMVVDPGTGRVFVSGDDAVAVYAPDGTALTTIDGVPGAWGLDAAQQSIWVNESTTGRIARIDPVTMAVAQRYDVGQPLRDDLTIVGNVAWFGRWNPEGGLGRFDFTTSTSTTINLFGVQATARLGLAKTDAILAYERGSSGGRLLRIPTSPPYDATAVADAYAYLDKGSAVTSPDGSRVWSAGNASAALEWDGTTLASTGVKYQTNGPVARLSYAASRGVLALTADASVQVFTPDAPAPIAKVPLAGTTSVVDLDLAADGDAAFVLADDEDGGQSLRRFDIRPTATASAPASAVSGNPTKITVTGHALGGTTSVTIGGVTVAPTSTAPDQVTFETPASLAPGAQLVTLTGRTGVTSTSISLVPSTGATLTGTVRVGHTPVAGVAVSLKGSALTSPLATTTSAGGTYALTGIPAGAGYELTVHDPASAAPDQYIRNIGLLPNSSTSLDVDLSRPNGDGAELARTELGSARVRDLLVVPTTGRVVIATGDEVDILDGEGRLLTRIQGMYGARSLSRVGTTVYVGLADVGRVTRIDLATSTITGSWPVGGRTNGAIAASGGKVWFVDGDDQWTHLRWLDPATGALGPITQPQYYLPDLRSVEGSTDRFLAAEWHEAAVLDGTKPTVTQVADSYSAGSSPTAPLIGVASIGKVYDADGRRYRLSDLGADGMDHPGTGTPAYTAGAGGVVAIGGTVSRADDPTATHDFGTGWTATGLDAAGNRFYATQGDDLVIEDLRPHLTSATPDPLYAGRTATLTGTGLGVVTGLTVDGAARTFTGKGPSTVAIDLTGLAVGLHRIVVTTPWGSSNPTALTVIAPRPPRTPLGVAAGIEGIDVRVAFAAPDDDGGRTVTGYRATASPGGKTCTSATAGSCTITGLTPGASYTFTVRAINAIGDGIDSAPTTAVRVPTAPGVPGDVAAVAGGSSATIEWKSPVDNGGATVTSYRVCHSTEASVPPATATCSTTTSRYATISGLTPGTGYYATVAATSLAGTGPPSTPVGPVIPFTVPGSPSGLQVVAGDRSATLTWTAPTVDGGSPVMGYRLCAATDPAALTQPSSCHTQYLPSTTGDVVELEGGTTYSFTVAAWNWAGYGQPTAVSTATLPASVPDAPASVTAAPGRASLEVSWTAPAHDGGSAVTGFEVCAGTDQALTPATTRCTTVTDGAARSASIDGLAPGTGHHVVVAAINAVGTGARRFATGTAFPFTVPSAPVNVVAVAQDHRVVVSWGGPASDGGSSLTGVVVTPYLGSTAQTPVTITGWTTSADITGLTNKKAYTFTVQATNAGGPGTPTTPTAATTPFAMPAPFRSWDEFVERQLGMFTASPGTTASRAATVAQLAAGTLDPGEFIAGLIAKPWYGPTVAPVVRLYSAYFGRLPDQGGLGYWTMKRRHGTTLIRISASFAASSEFKRTYGSLSNAAFVDLVYRNVLGRPGDPGGRAYWVKKLGQGASRGQVMTNFSESGEYIRKTAGRVGVVEVYGGMLRRSPTAAELDQWQDETTTSLIEHIRMSAEYTDEAA